MTHTSGALQVDLGACVVLVIQFLLGMVVNLFVDIHHPGAKAHNFFTGTTSAIGWVIPRRAWVARRPRDPRPRPRRRRPR